MAASSDLHIDLFPVFLVKILSKEQLSCFSRCPRGTTWALASEYGTELCTSHSSVASVREGSECYVVVSALVFVSVNTNCLSLGRVRLCYFVHTESAYSESVRGSLSLK